MRNVIWVSLLFISGVSLILSCAKYKDSKAVTDPRLTNPYCNDPTAVNYNWGFPGKPDNTVCFYPTDVFKGVYLYHDSVFLPPPSGIFIHADSLVLYIHRLSNTKISILGFCSNGDSLLLTASPLYVASIDTTEGDSVTNWGQRFCSAGDTVNGTVTKDRINDSLMYFSFQVASDTGIVTTHIGSARRIQ
jgi:hypothetical protein